VTLGHRLGDDRITFGFRGRDEPSRNIGAPSSLFMSQ
jgi:hypothetical protein